MPRRSEEPEFISAADAERWGYSIGEVDTALCHENTLRVAFLDSEGVAYFRLADILALR